MFVVFVIFVAFVIYSLFRPLFLFGRQLFLSIP